MRMTIGSARHFHYWGGPRQSRSRVAASRRAWRVPIPVELVDVNNQPEINKPSQIISTTTM